MNHRIAELTDRRVISLSGDERKSFLQGLITNDVERAAPGKWLYAGLLTPQGKYLYDFFITEDGDSLLLDCAADHVSALTRKLMMYRLRSKVDITETDKAIFAHWVGAAEDFADPRLSQMGSRRFDGAANATQDDYKAHRLSLGVPDGPADFAPEKTLWLETNADLLSGVDFEKGCYVGQELTARMRYRGIVRRRLIPIRAEADIPENTPILLGERQIGDTRSASGTLGLANLRVEDLAKGPLMAGGVEITAWLPDWLAPVQQTKEDEAVNGEEKEAV